MPLVWQSIVVAVMACNIVPIEFVEDARQYKSAVSDINSVSNLKLMTSLAALTEESLCISAIFFGTFVSVA